MRMAPLKLDVTVREERTQEDIAKIIEQIKPSWDSRKICLKPFTSGLTNKIVRCYEDDENDSLLIRINGAKTERFVDRDIEYENIMLLHKERLASQVFARLNNGLVYKYLPGITLDYKSAKDPKIFPLVCDNVAKMHAISTPGSVEGKDFISLYLKYITTSFPDPQTQTLFEKEFGSKKEIERIASELQEIIRSTTYPLVFSHNDLLLDNIIYNESLNIIRFIDFEFAGYNYQPFDIALHFVEFAGSTDRDDSRFPDKSFQLVWIKEYLKRYNYYTESSNEVTDEQVEDFQAACDKFAAILPFIEALWGLAQMNESCIEFDFLQYAVDKMKTFRKHMGKLFSTKDDTVA